ncbi:MAG: DUF481 domain-containing protein [Phycisphaerales bacterium JB040]
MFKTCLSLPLLAGLACGPAIAQDDTEQPAQQQPTIEEAEARVKAARAEKDEAQALLDEAKSELAAAEGALKEVKPLTLSQGWEFTALVGLNGSSGNTEAFNFRTLIGGSRESMKLDTEVRLLYINQTSEGIETDDSFLAEITNDWLFQDSKWRTFAEARYEYDEYEDWLHRISGFAGVGYEFLGGPEHKLIGRAGAGGNQTVGGEDQGFHPEGFLQADYEWTISDKNSFRAGATYFPSFENGTDFRVESYAEYRITLSEQSSMVLVMGVEDEYDSDPGGTAKKNDLDYYLTLGWTF